MLKRSSDPQEYFADSLRRNPKFPRQTRVPAPSLFTEVDFMDSSPSSLKRSYRPLSRALDSQRIVPKYRPRFASMPQPISSELQAQIDIDNDRIARGLASPPLVDFSTFEDTYRGPRDKEFAGLFAESVEPKIKPILKRNRSSSAGVFDVQKSLSPLNLPSDRKPDPRLIVAALEQMLNLGPQDIGEHLDIHELLGMHQLDQLNFEEKDAIRTQMFHGGRRSMQDLTVFGEHLRKVSIYASIKMVLGGREHELPIVVVSTVEELYRTGIYQHNLFRTLPNRARLLQLINIFDSQRQPTGNGTRRRISSGELPNLPSAGFGADTSLHLESTPDICALLSTYLASLPEPILLPTLFRAVWDWCGVAEENNDFDGSRLFSSRLIGIHTQDKEVTRIKTAQLLLHLLPSPNFSLLVYLLSFFSQVILVRGENGLGVEDVGRMFGGKIFGGGTTRKHHGSGGERRREGETMMCWFMNRWGTISEGLFNVGEEFTSREESGDGQVTATNGSVGTLGQTPQSVSFGDFGSSPSISPSTLNLPFIRPLEIGKGSLNHLPPSAGGISSVNERHPHKHTDSTSDEHRFNVGHNRPLSVVEKQLTSPPGVDPYYSWGNHHAETADRKLGEPNKGQSVFLSPSPASSNDRVDVCSAQDISSDAASIQSAPALEERLLDISLPSVAEDSNQEPPTSASTPRPSSANTNPELSQARSHILSLELKLKMSELLIEESAQEKTKATEKVLVLENRVKELELHVKRGDGARVGVDDGVGCGQRVGSDEGVVSRALLETALGERDISRRLVADIKDLIEHQLPV